MTPIYTANVNFETVYGLIM